MRVLRGFLVALAALSIFGVASAADNYSDVMPSAKAVIDFYNFGFYMPNLLNYLDAGGVQTDYPSYPIQWSGGDNQYNDHLHYNDADLAVNSAINRFYNVPCKAKQFDANAECNHLIGGQYGGKTGTSIDTWRELNNGALLISFPTVSSYPDGYGTNLASLGTCNTPQGAITYKAGSFSNAGIVEYFYYIDRSAIPGADNMTNINSGGDNGSSGPANVLTNAISLDCPKATLRQWYQGTYRILSSAQPTAELRAHSDVPTGLAIIFTDILSDDARVSNVSPVHMLPGFDQLHVVDDGFTPPRAGQPSVPTGGTSGSGGSGGTGTTGTSSPACVKGDGTTSGNPYDCAPQDDELKCSIIDIPCNLRKLFIPRASWLQSRFVDGTAFQLLHFPTEPADYYTFEFNGQEMHVDFADVHIPDIFKNVTRFLIYQAILLYSLDVFGLPNPFRRGGTPPVNGPAGDAVRSSYPSRGRRR